MSNNATTFPLPIIKAPTSAKEADSGKWTDNVTELSGTLFEPWHMKGTGPQLSYATTRSVYGTECGTRICAIEECSNPDPCILINFSWHDAGDSFCQVCLGFYCIQTGSRKNNACAIFTV